MLRRLAIQTWNASVALVNLALCRSRFHLAIRTLAAYPGSGGARVVAVAAAAAVVAGRAFAAVAGSVVGASALPAVFWHRLPSAGPASGVPDPASAAAAVAPGAAWFAAFPAVVDISYPSLDFRNLGCWADPYAEYL